MGHGGRRPGAGRKPNPLKDVRIGAATAEKILRELGHEQEIVKLYRECGDPRLKVQILFRLREWAYGKASQPLEHPGGDKPVQLTSGGGPDAAKRLAELLERVARRPAAATRTEAWTCPHCQHVHTPVTLRRLDSVTLECERCKRPFPSVAHTTKS